mgnify:CR=1 FL=1
MKFARRIVNFFTEGTKQVYADLFGNETKEVSDAEIMRILEKRHRITERNMQSTLADLMEKSHQAISKALKK